MAVSFTSTSRESPADHRPETVANGRDVADLFAAVRSGSLDAVRAQQAKGTPLDLADDNGRTALMSAAEAGLVDMVETLVAEGCALGAKSLLGWTALTYAAFAGHEAVLRLLAARGLAVDERDVSSATPLAWAAAKGHAATVRALLELGADVHARDVHGRTALAHCAGGVADLETLAALLAGACDVDAADVAGRTPLMVAVLANKPFAVDALIKAGADASLTDAHTPAILGPPSGPSDASMGREAEAEAPAAASAPVGKTALELAKERKHKHIERYLLAVGARTEGSADYPPVIDQVLVRERMLAKMAKQQADGASAPDAGEGGARPAAAARAAADDDIFSEMADDVADLAIRGESAAAEAELPHLSKIEDSLEDLD